MIEKKVVFIIPGFRHRPTNIAYKAIAKILKNEGYFPILITIPWKQTTISENTEYFLKKYMKIKAKKKYILGFSFGAMIALLASTKTNVSGIILCSLSPYFQEDVTRRGKRRFLSTGLLRHRDFSSLHCGTLAKHIKAKKILMLYGTDEERSLIRRVNEAFDQITSTEKYLFSIKKTEHDIGDRRYLQAVQDVAKVLS